MSFCKLYFVYEFLFRLGFEQCSYVECFDEYEYELKLDSQATREIILSRVSHMIEADYYDQTSS